MAYATLKRRGTTGNGRTVNARGTEFGQVIISEEPGELQEGKKLALSLNTATEANKLFDVDPTNVFKPSSYILIFSNALARDWNLELINTVDTKTVKLRAETAHVALETFGNFPEFQDGISGDWKIRFQGKGAAVATSVDIYIYYKENASVASGDE